MLVTCDLQDSKTNRSSGVFNNLIAGPVPASKKLLYLLFYLRKLFLLGTLEIPLNLSFWQVEMLKISEI